MIHDNSPQNIHVGMSLNISRNRDALIWINVSSTGVSGLGNVFSHAAGESLALILMFDIKCSNQINSWRKKYFILLLHQCVVVVIDMIFPVISSRA